MDRNCVYNDANQWTNRIKTYNQIKLNPPTRSTFYFLNSYHMKIDVTQVDEVFISKMATPTSLSKVTSDTHSE